MTTRLFALFTLLALAVGCSADYTATDSSDSDVAGDDLRESARTLQGRWSTPCHHFIEVAGTHLYGTTRLHGTRRDFRYSLSLFVDPACSIPFTTYEERSTYTMSPSRTAPRLFDLDVTFASRTMRADSPAALPLLNAGCGTTPWVVGVAQDILVSGCPVAGFQPQTECSMDHDIVRFCAADRFAFGQRPADNDMCTPERRASSLSVVEWRRDRATPARICGDASVECAP